MRLSALPDHETDSIIQNTLRRELGADVTVLTIAHRLQTIMDADRIVSGSSVSDQETAYTLRRWSWMQAAS